MKRSIFYIVFISIGFSTNSSSIKTADANSSNYLMLDKANWLIGNWQNLSNNQFVFENPTHDFPQKITYTLISNDSLNGLISGIVKGVEKSQKFSMIRTK